MFLLVVSAGCLKEPPDPADVALEAAIRAGEWETTAPAARADFDPLHTRPEALSDALGAWRYEAVLTVSYVGDDGVLESRVEEKTAVDVAADGRFSLRVGKEHSRVDDPDGTSGRWAVFDGKRFYTRLDGGVWIVQDLLRREHERWLVEATRHLEVLTKLLGRSLTRTAKGRTVRLATPKWKPAPIPKGKTLETLRATDGDDWYRWWAHTHRPTTVSGVIALHDEVEAVASATVTIRAETTGVRTPREDTAGPEAKAKTNLFGPTVDTMRAAAEAPREEDAATLDKAREATARFSADLVVSIRRIDEPAIWPPPAEQVHDARRPRVHHMIESILKQEATR